MAPASAVVTIASTAASLIPKVSDDAPSLHISAEFKSLRIKAVKYIPEANVLVASSIVPVIYGFDPITMQSLWSLSLRGVFGGVRALDIYSRVLVCGFDDFSLRVLVFPSHCDDAGHATANYRVAPSLSTELPMAHLDYIRCVQFQPCNVSSTDSLPPKLITASDDQTVRLFVWGGTPQYPTLKQERVMTGHNHYVMCATWLPPHPYGGAVFTEFSSSIALSCGLDAAVRVWDTDSGKCIATASKVHNLGINWIAAAPIHSQPRTTEALQREWLIVTTADDRNVGILRLEAVCSNTQSPILLYVQRIVSGIHFNNINAVFLSSPPSTETVWSVAATTVSEDCTIASLKITLDTYLSTPVVEHSYQTLQSSALGSRYWAVCPMVNGQLAAAHDHGVSIVGPQPLSPSSTPAIIHCGDTTVTLPIGGHIIDIEEPKKGSEGGVFGGNRIVLEYTTNREAMVKGLAVLSILALLVALLGILSTVFSLVEASKFRAVRWHEPFSGNPWNWVMLMLSIPAALTSLFNVITKTRVLLTVTRASLSGENTSTTSQDSEVTPPWGATIEITWSSLLNNRKGKRNSESGYIRFKVTSKTHFTTGQWPGALTASVPVTDAELSDFPQELHTFTPNEGETCRCGGKHLLSERFIVPMFVHGPRGCLTCVSPAAAVPHAPAQWVGLAQAVSQTGGQCSFYVE